MDTEVAGLLQMLVGIDSTNPDLVPGGAGEGRSGRPDGVAAEAHSGPRRRSAPGKAAGARKTLGAGRGIVSGLCLSFDVWRRRAALFRPEELDQVEGV